MRQQNIRKVRWDKERNRAYVVRDGVRYWAQEGKEMYVGLRVAVFNPTPQSITVKYAGLRETWLADATSSGQGG